MVSLDSFSTARLAAERLTRDHAAEIRRMHRDPAVMATLGGVRDAAKTEAYFERNLRHWSEHGFGLWIVRERGGGEPIGRALLRHVSIDEMDDVEVGYGFYQPFWGRGLATEVAAACLGLARTELRLRSVVGLTLPTNAASQHVLRKSGLAHERDIEHDGLTQSLFRIRFEA